MRLLVVDDYLELWYGIAKNFNQQIPAEFFQGDDDMCKKRGYAMVGNKELSVYLTGELGSAKNLIQRMKFDMYFLDNQIYDYNGKDTVLAHEELVTSILKVCRPTDNQRKQYPIVNISSHASNARLGVYFLRECNKSVKEILEIANENK